MLIPLFLATLRLTRYPRTSHLNIYPWPLHGRFNLLLLPVVDQLLLSLVLCRFLVGESAPGEPFDTEFVRARDPAGADWPRFS